MVIDAPLPYNILIGRLIFKSLEAVLSTLYLTMKCQLNNGRVGTIKGNQEQDRLCY